MTAHFHRSQRGTSLVEVMITLVIGLIVSAGAIAMVISNREAYRSTEALSRVQESTRVAFELMSRDLRAAGINTCNGGRTRVLNLLEDPATRWWSDWTGGLRGFEGTTASLAAVIGTDAGQRVTGTDLVEVMHGGTSALAIAMHNASASEATIGGGTVPKFALVTQQASTLAAGDLAIVCDFENSTIFQVSGVDPDSHSIQHEVIESTPGNCSSGLAFRTPLVCNGGAGTAKVFQAGSQIMRLETAAWYVGVNGRTGNTNSPRSLYRVSVRNEAGTLTSVAEEIVEGVVDMEITYVVDGAYLDAASVTALNKWSEVTGAQIMLTIEAPETGTSTAAVGARLTRTLSHVVNLRNRVS